MPRPVHTPEARKSLHSTLGVLLFLGLAIPAFVYLILGHTQDRILHDQARLSAERWISFFGREVPQLREAFATGTLTQEQIAQIERGQLMGEVFRYKMFDTAGRLFYVSDTGIFDVPSDAEVSAIAAMRTGQSVVSLEDGTANPSRPDAYAEAYAPVRDKDGGIIGAMEVYVDQSAQEDVLVSGFRWLLIGLPLLCALIYLAPSSAFLVARGQRNRRDAALAEARFDALTGVLDRRNFMREAEEALREADAAKAPTGIVYLDVDKFKSVNDKIGHAGGDAYLRFVVNAVMGKTSPGFLVGRMGGDEFAIVAPGLDAGGLRDLAEALCSSVRQPFIYRGIAFSGSVSVGTYLADAGVTLRDALDRADTAAYAAKASGRDRFCAWEDTTRVNPLIQRAG